MEEMVEIYRKYMPQVYNFLFSLCHDAHLSEELTQETFSQTLKSIDSFRGDCKIYVWLCSIAKHLWYKELKKKDREVVAEYVEETTCQKITENSAIQKMEVIELYKKLHFLIVFLTFFTIFQVFFDFLITFFTCQPINI